jgi:hypothetical protein
MKRKEHIELLKQILATTDLSDLPEAVRDSANEAIADFGGCAYCGRAATILCDFYLGGEIDETHTKWPCYKSDGEPFTCDAPLCEQCRVVVGMTTITGVPTAIDHCPYHARINDAYHARPMTKHEAERLRIVAWKRSLFTHSSPGDE